MLTIFFISLIALGILVIASTVVYALGCAGRLIFWICGIIWVLFFLLLLL